VLSADWDDLSATALGILEDLRRPQWHRSARFEHLDPGRSPADVDRAVGELLRAGRIIVDPDPDGVVVRLPCGS